MAFIVTWSLTSSQTRNWSLKEHFWTVDDASSVVYLPLKHSCRFFLIRPWCSKDIRSVTTLNMTSFQRWNTFNTSVMWMQNQSARSWFWTACFNFTRTSKNCSLASNPKGTGLFGTNLEKNLRSETNTACIRGESCVKTGLIITSTQPGCRPCHLWQPVVKFKVLPLGIKYFLVSSIILLRPKPFIGVHRSDLNLWLTRNTFISSTNGISLHSSAAHIRLFTSRTFVVWKPWRAFTDWLGYTPPF